MYSKHRGYRQVDRHTPRGYHESMSKDMKLKVARRLKIIEGQVRGLQKMVEGDKYCIDIITQASAVKEALSGVEDMLLENHLSTQVIAQVKEGNEVTATDEILRVYKLKRRR